MVWWCGESVRAHGHMSFPERYTVATPNSHPVEPSSLVTMHSYPPPLLPSLLRCAVVPLDPDSPCSRLTSMLRDCGARILLCSEEREGALSRLLSPHQRECDGPRWVLFSVEGLASAPPSSELDGADLGSAIVDDADDADDANDVVDGAAADDTHDDDADGEADDDDGHANDADGDAAMIRLCY